MKEKELKSILDREKHKEDARKIYLKQIELLVDLANYGSNLIVRAFDSSKKRFEDIIVICVLLKQVVAMLDTVEVLVSNGIVKPASLQTRCAFEASLYIDWILKEESEKKAKYYYVSNLRDQRLWTLRYLRGTPENELFSQTISDLKEYLEPRTITEKDEAEARHQVAGIDRILSQEGYREINDEFERRIRKKSRTEAYWYEPFRISSVRQLAKDVGRLSEYVIIYSTGSEFSHATSYKDHVKLGQGKITLEPIRQLKGADPILQSIMGITLHSYKSILKHYRDGELTNFADKYIKEWRDGYQNIPHVSYVEDHTVMF